MSRSAPASRAGRAAGFESATVERFAHKLAYALGVYLNKGYVDPYQIKIYSARGYWTHSHQDVQRWTGNFPRPGLPELTYSLGSWYGPVSVLDRYGFVVFDDRAENKTGGVADNDFQVEPLSEKSDRAAYVFLNREHKDL